MRNLQRFAVDTVMNKTTSTGLTNLMKTYYDTELLENARPSLYYSQFAKKQPLPRNNGRTVEFRKWNTLKNATKLEEGVIPNGQNLSQTNITASLEQYGTYVTVTDLLDLHAIDPVILGATEELGASAGLTVDTLVRDVAMAGTNVMYADKVSGGSRTEVTSRAGLDTTALLDVTTVNQAVTNLKKLNAPTINGKYVAIIHPSVAYDLRECDGWIEAHKYASPTEIYNGEIGELHGVRFVESTQAKVFGPTEICDIPGLNRTQVASAVTSDDDITITDAISAADATAVNAAISGGATYKIYLDGVEKTVASVTAGAAGAAIITLSAAVTVAKDKYLCGQGGTPAGDAVYGCLFLGKDAYGQVDPDGGGLEMIVKTRDEIGGPLNQFSTVGYKFEDADVILYEERMVRVECCSAYSGTDAAN